MDWRFFTAWRRDGIDVCVARRTRLELDRCANWKIDDTKVRICNRSSDLDGRGAIAACLLAISCFCMCIYAGLAAATRPMDRSLVISRPPSWKLIVTTRHE